MQNGQILYDSGDYLNCGFHYAHALSKAIQLVTKYDKYYITRLKCAKFAINAFILYDYTKKGNIADSLINKIWQFCTKELQRVQSEIDGNNSLVEKTFKKGD